MLIDIGADTQPAQMIKKVLGPIVDDDEVFQLYARMFWRSYVALKNVGFSHDEAMQIITSPAFKVTS